jgi:hypothetical protein
VLVISTIVPLHCFKNHTQPENCKSTYKLIESYVMLGLSSPEGGQRDSRRRVVVLLVIERYIVMNFIIRQEGGSREFGYMGKTQTDGKVKLSPCIK